MSIMTLSVLTVNTLVAFVADCFCFVVWPYSHEKQVDLKEVLIQLIDI